jgi:peptidoglycan/xylan/chitin deacetylase (PgdA/CDA1 family)
VPALSLTFDDGPDPTWTPRVLDALERAGARATFFVIAPRAVAHDDLVAATLAGGHRVELHCGRHLRHTAATREEVAHDLREAIGALARLGVRPALWRTPWGVRAPWSAALAAAHGLRLCRWSADTRDWRGDPARLMLARVAPWVGPGASILMHDGLGPGARRSGCAETVALVEPLVALGRRRGLEPLPMAA